MEILNINLATQLIAGTNSPLNKGGMRGMFIVTSK